MSDTGVLCSRSNISLRKIEDIYIAVMGVTGAGKSSFIELCTGNKIGVGNGLRSRKLSQLRWGTMADPMQTLRKLENTPSC